MNNLHTATHWITTLNLQPHPEGGYYREVFRSEQVVTRENSSSLKQACTSIYYLLKGDDFSGFHRLKSDELWYFHKGAPLLIHVLNEQGEYSAHELSDTETGSLSIAIKAGLWFASEIPSKTSFALVSCAVAPGFDFSEFEMAQKEKLTDQFPQHATLLNRLCRE
jgi:predicted cupin superfamily sugar epimerase